jgi:regulator of replication initiation timing
MKKYINAVLSIGTVGILFYTLFDLKKQVTTLKKEVVTITAQRDSLHDENFIKQIEIGRYELTLNYLETVNPKAALQFVNYMGHETE